MERLLREGQQMRECIALSQVSDSPHRSALGDTFHLKYFSNTNNICYNAFTSTLLTVRPCRLAAVQRPSPSGPQAYGSHEAVTGTLINALMHALPSHFRPSANSPQITPGMHHAIVSASCSLARL